MYKLLLLILLTAPSLSFADSTSPNLSSIDINASILPTLSETINSNLAPLQKKQSIINPIKKNLQPSAIRNLEEAEQIFCYEIHALDDNYTGYTLDSYALTGYCGELNNDQTLTIKENLFMKNQNLILTNDNCDITPRLMLRFTRGVDYTDVLLSTPCPSFTVIYAGKTKKFNVKQSLIKDLIALFSDNIVDFNSPSFLKQTVANGTPEDDKQKQALEKEKRKEAPFLKWDEQPSSEETTKETPQKTGWGKSLNTKKRPVRKQSL